MEKQACTTAIHAKDGNNHCVTLSALRVMLLEDSSGWFAQGLEIDYAASGATIDEVKKKFETGFSATLREHLKMFGSIERFLSPANGDAWKEFYHMPKNADCQTYSCIEFHKIDEEIGDKTGSMKLPFDQIAFLSQQPQQQREAVLA